MKLAALAGVLVVAGAAQWVNAAVDTVFMSFDINGFKVQLSQGDPLFDASTFTGTWTITKAPQTILASIEVGTCDPATRVRLTSDVIVPSDITGLLVFDNGTITSASVSVTVGTGVDADVMTIAKVGPNSARSTEDNVRLWGNYIATFNHDTFAGVDIRLYNGGKLGGELFSFGPDFATDLNIGGWNDVQWDFRLYPVPEASALGLLLTGSASVLLRRRK